MLLAVGLLVLAGCDQAMREQPKYEPLEVSLVFPDGQSARQLPSGTVPRGFLRADVHLYAGLVASEEGGEPQPAAEFPFPISPAVLERGQERYGIFCAICHDAAGTGFGKIVERGYVRPPSFHEERLREAPVGYFFAVITEGFGAMPEYASHIPPRDRWAIIAYIRALQLSQAAVLEELPEDLRQEALAALEESDGSGTPESN